MEETVVGPFHVPQQTLRHKLRQNDAVEHFSHLQTNHHSGGGGGGGGGGLHLSLSTTYAACTGGSFTATPIGPFTGYASILGRSRFLRPAQDLLEEFCRGVNGTTFQKDPSKLLEDSGSLFADDEPDVSRRCNNPTLLSMLHEVYKRYKLYCQQMQSAVTSFESVAGLGNATPFVCSAIKTMFKHFQCLKNAILDHIHITGKVFGSMDIRKGCASASCSESKGLYEQKLVLDPSFLQHPVWRSQRGFPDKAVAVLRTWLFEHFLHPYPSDADKQLLAQKTGLSRSQVSNWFTNARVRLWKPMVEEIHALERKTQCSKTSNTSKFPNISSDHHFSELPHLAQKDFQIYTHREQESHSKRTRIEEHPRIDQSKEQYGIPCSQLMSNQTAVDVSGSQTDGRLVNPSSVLGSNPEAASGLSWSSPAQIVPFWLANGSRN